MRWGSPRRETNHKISTFLLITHSSLFVRSVPTALLGSFLVQRITNEVIQRRKTSPNDHGT